MTNYIPSIFHFSLWIRVFGLSILACLYFVVIKYSTADFEVFLYFSENLFSLLVLILIFIEAPITLLGILSKTVKKGTKNHKTNLWKKICGQKNFFIFIILFVHPPPTFTIFELWHKDVTTKFDMKNIGNKMWKLSQHYDILL